MLWILGGWHAIVPALKTPEEDKKPNPAHARLLTPEQHKHAYKLYMVCGLMPKVVARDLNVKFGTNFKPVQITEYARAEDWSAKRKKLKDLVVEPKTHEIVQKYVKRAENQHKEFLEASARIASKGLAKAEKIIDRAVDAKTLGSALGSANVAANMYRKAVGLVDGDSKQAAATVFNIHFAKGEGSPFSMKKAVPADAEEDGEEEVSELLEDEELDRPVQS